MPSSCGRRLLKGYGSVSLGHAQCARARRAARARFNYHYRLSGMRSNSPFPILTERSSPAHFYGRYGLCCIAMLSVYRLYVMFGPSASPEHHRSIIEKWECRR